MWGIFISFSCSRRASITILALQSQQLQGVSSPRGSAPWTPEVASPSLTIYPGAALVWLYKCRHLCYFVFSTDYNVFCVLFPDDERRREQDDQLDSTFNSSSLDSSMEMSWCWWMEDGPAMYKLWPNVVLKLMDQLAYKLQASPQYSCEREASSCQVLLKTSQNPICNFLFIHHEAKVGIWIYMVKTGLQEEICEASCLNCGAFTSAIQVNLHPFVYPCIVQHPVSNMFG